MKHVSFAGRLVMLGCGSIGQGVLPLILRHIDMPRDRIHILTADARGSDVAAEFGVALTVAPVTRENFRDLLAPLLGRGDFLLNLSVDVSSVALIALCQELGARASLRLFEDADHSFHVPARSGRKDTEVMSEMLDTFAAWADGVIAR